MTPFEKLKLPPNCVVVSAHEFMVLAAQHAVTLHSPHSDTTYDREHDVGARNSSIVLKFVIEPTD
jgi:hypothetical protein